MTAMLAAAVVALLIWNLWLTAAVWRMRRANMEIFSHVFGALDSMLRGLKQLGRYVELTIGDGK